MKKRLRYSPASPDLTRQLSATATFPTGEEALSMDSLSGLPKSATSQEGPAQSSSLMLGSTSSTHELFMKSQGGTLGHVPGEFEVKLLEISEEVLELEEEMAELAEKVADRVGSLCHDPYFEGLTNERARQAFIDEYLAYDHLIEGPLKVKAKRDHLYRKYEILMKVM